MNQPLIEGVDLSCKMGNTTLFEQLAITIRRGEHCFIEGLNGSGKTSLLKILSGQKTPNRGHIKIHEVPYEEIKFVSFTDEGKLFNSVNNSHYYQQRFNAWDADGHLTCHEYLIAKGVNLELEQNKAIIETLNLEELLFRERIKLSSGQTRKLILAACLMTKASILFLDNLYIGLDKVARKTLNDYLSQLVKAQPITLILSSHQCDPPSFIETQYHLSKTGLNKGGNKKIKDLFSKEIEPSITKYINTQIRTDFQEIVAFNNLSVSYKEKAVLQSLTWYIRRGEKWCLRGGNGSGKSTIMSLINADHPQMYAKDIRLFGKRPGPGVPIWDIKENIGFTSPELHAYLNTEQDARSLIFTLIEIRKRRTEAENLELEKALTGLLNYYELSDKIDLSFASLSTGEQRIFLLIAALLRAPQLLLLDEPFQGFDQINMARSKHLLNNIVAADQSLIFISHFESEVPESVNLELNLEEN